MERLSQLSAQLSAALTWMEDARRLLAKAADQAEGEGAGAGADAGNGGAAGAGGGEDSGSAVDVAGSGLPAAAEGEEDSAAAAQGAASEPEASFAAALLAAAEAEAEAAALGGGRGTPPLAALGALPAHHTRSKKKGGRPPKAPKRPAEPATARPSLQAIEALLDQYAQLLVRAEETAAGLRALRGLADGWLEEARPVLEQDFVTGELNGIGHCWYLANANEGC